MSTSVCLIVKLPFVQVEAAAVVARATVSATFVAVQASAIVPMASLCTSAALAGRAAEVSAIADTTIACIKEKLSA